jgi:hypothetical protein
MTIRTPEPFWKTTGPKAPWGDFDVDAALHFEMDLSPWLLSAGPNLTLVEAIVICDSPLQIDDQIVDDSIVLQVTAVAGQVLVPGTFLRFKVKWRASDGQRDGRSFWLRIKDR